MAYPSLTFATLLDNATRTELEQLISLLQGYLSAQHDEEGAHTDITADSITVEGDVTADGDGTFGGAGTFGGDVIAQSDTSPVTIGAVGAVSGVGIRMQTVPVPTATDNDWVWVAGNSGAVRQMSLRDVLEAGDTAMLDIKRTGSSTYDVRPHSSAITLTLGTDASGQRWSEVNAVTATVSGTLTPNKTTTTTFGLSAAGRLGPAQITGNVNDYAISSGASRVYLNSDAARDITGIVAGFEGQHLWLINFGSFAITLKNNSGSSSAANRIVGANSSDVVLRANNGSALLHYDTGSALWYVLGA